VERTETILNVYWEFNENLHDGLKYSQR